MAANDVGNPLHGTELQNAEVDARGGLDTPRCQGRSAGDQATPACQDWVVHVWQHGAMVTWCWIWMDEGNALASVRTCPAAGDLCLDRTSRGWILRRGQLPDGDAG